MEAQLLLRERRILGESRFIEIVIWEVPEPLSGSRHGFKYRLAFVIDEMCVLRFDNEAGKGDHKHLGGEQVPYRFRSLAQLVTDFWDAVEAWRDP
ncbi:MAG: toxin-antitoxin system TumE family protein [Stellaceae bacterium]